MGSAEATQAQGSETKFEFKRLGYTLQLVVSGDKLTCTVVYSPTSNGAPLTHDELRGFLSQAKIVEGLDEAGIAALVAAAAQGKSLSATVVARGQAMLPGEDGWIELAVSDALADEPAEADEEQVDDGRVDLRRVQSFLNVSTGQVIGKVMPPGPGTAGKSVHGSRIAPQSGKLLQLQIERGIRLADDGVSLYAEADGRLCLRGGEISVEDTYAVKGDVDFKVGNIVFNGFVDIKGDVLDGFTVKATKGIRIQGNIGVCEVASEGDISFCGMNGQGKGSVVCGGNVTANFIADAQVDCEGDVLVETEIRSSYIHANGCIKVNKGILTGGECVALGGIESSIIGTVSSQRTRVVAGVCQRDLQELNRLFNELKELIANFNAAGRTMDTAEFARGRADITARIQEVRSRVYPARNPKVNVKKHLYEGVSLTIGQLSEDLREGKDGPFSMIENTLEGGFRYLGLTDLSVKAQQIEEAFVQQEELIRKQQGGAA